MDRSADTSLRHLLGRADFCDLKRPFLERLASMFHQARTSDETVVRSRLGSLREAIGPTPSGEEDLLLSLHAAILLSQFGEFDAVTALLLMLHRARQGDEPGPARSIETALRNCSRFPIAAMCGRGLSLDPPAVASSRALLQLSDDDVAGRVDGAAAKRLEEEFLQLVARSKSAPGREIAFGTVACAPLLRDQGQRFAGFLVVERGNRPPLAVPFDSGDVINQHDAQAREDINGLLRTPRRRVVVVYQRARPFEALDVYLLPFAPTPPRKLGELLHSIATRGDGADVGAVAEVRRNEGKYRMISVGGRSRLSSHRVDRQTRGRCFLFHDDNSLPLETEVVLEDGQLDLIAGRFKDNTSAPRAAYLALENGVPLLACEDGAARYRAGARRDECYFVDKSPAGGTSQYLYYSLHGQSWTPEERVEILQKHIEAAPSAWGVVIDSYREGRKQYARVVHAGSGAVQDLSTDAPVVPGTLAYFFAVPGSDVPPRALIAHDYRLSGGCPDCHGCERRPCPSCEARGTVSCPDCKGTARCPCGRCSGSGEDACEQCNGGAKLYVGNLNWSTSDDDLRNVFGDYGKVKAAEVVYDSDGSHRGIGFVTFSDSRSADGAMKYMDGTEFIGRTIRVRKATCRRCRDSGHHQCGACRGSGTEPCVCRSGRMVCGACRGGGVCECGCGGGSQGTLVAIT